MCLIAEKSESSKNNNLIKIMSESVHKLSDNKKVINDMTYVGQPTAGEYSFQYADVPEIKQIATNIIDILNGGKGGTEFP